jgi:hydrogenase nickel incorporation protein HypB
MSATSCVPASYDLGEDLRAVLLSVTEGEDKPLKYPTIFNTADVAVITKIDLADVVGFRREEAYANIAAVRPGLEIIETSARAEHSMQRWLERLEHLRTRPRGQIAGSIAIN